MSNYAYKDVDRKEIINANDAMKASSDTKYYCPNPQCNAILYICSKDGIRSPYFRATKKEYGHIDDCYYSKNRHFNITDYDESKFDFEDALASLENTNMTNSTLHLTKHYGSILQKTTLKTIKQIYHMCKSKDVQDNYNGVYIHKMLLDNRSIKIADKGCYGRKLIEAKTHKHLYDSDKKEIYLIAPVNSQNSYHFILKFKDSDLFFKTKDILYNNQGNVIVTSGNWRQEKWNYFYTYIHSKKQIAIIK